MESKMQIIRTLKRVPIDWWNSKSLLERKLLFEIFKPDLNLDDDKSVPVIAIEKIKGLVEETIVEVKNANIKK